VEIETDKATMEVESTVDGVLQSIESRPEEMVAVGQVIATLEVPERAAGQTVQASTTRLNLKAPPLTLETGEDGKSSPPPAPKRSGMFARNRAAAAAPPPTSDGVAISIAQRTAARRLQESKQTIPHFYLQTSFNAEALIARRKAAEPAKIAWDAFFAQAVAKALKRFERMAYRIDGERLVPAPSDSVGVAVDVGGDLFVVGIAAPANRSAREISNEIRERVERLRGGDSDARRLPQVAMTISNLGSCNVESFIPIINPPEAAILGVGRIAPTCVAREAGIVVEHRATLTLSIDHRIVNGKYAGDFLTAVVRQLESSEVTE
jgi:pyruvate dehydrogenase E2 component (dihydrolipoamide acetyltransferase)